MSAERYVIARDAKHWHVYDSKNMKFVGEFRTRKGDARKDAASMNEALRRNIHNYYVQQFTTRD